MPVRWLWGLVAVVGLAFVAFSVLLWAGAGFALDWAYWLAYHLGLDPP